MEYRIRDARVTDVERIAALVEASAPGRTGGPTMLHADDLLRQLVYLPHAAVVVAESRRQIVGATVLALRPSVSQQGFVGTIDVLVVDPQYGETGIADSLIEETLRSARNKGCVSVEAPRPNDPGERTRWQGHGFRETGPRIARDLVPVGAARP